MSATIPAMTEPGAPPRLRAAGTEDSADPRPAHHPLSLNRVSLE